MPKPGYITIKAAAALAELSPRQFRKRIVDGRASGQYTEADAYEEDTERGKVWYVREGLAKSVGRLREPKVYKSVKTSKN